MILDDERTPREGRSWGSRPTLRAGQQSLTTGDDRSFGPREAQVFPVVLPVGDAQLRVGRFAELGRRIEAGARIFDETLADRAPRETAFQWALATPTLARVVYDTAAATGPCASRGRARAARRHSCAPRPIPAIAAEDVVPWADGLD